MDISYLSEKDLEKINSKKGLIYYLRSKHRNPKKIIEDMIKGISPSDFKKIIKVTDREKAIMESKRISQPGDIILIAGKGHENYQEIKGKRNPFDDYEIVKKYF